MANLAENRRASFDYEVSEKYEAGIELLGQEVKSVRSGQLQIAGARVLIRPSSSKINAAEAYLVTSQIPPYQAKNVSEDYAPDRVRRLLLTKAELKELADIMKDKSRVLIPLRAFTKNGFIKIELGLARARKKSDKREVIKKRSHNREMRQD